MIWGLVDRVLSEEGGWLNGYATSGCGNEFYLYTSVTWARSVLCSLENPSNESIEAATQSRRTKHCHLFACCVSLTCVYSQTASFWRYIYSRGRFAYSDVCRAVPALARILFSSIPSLNERLLLRSLRKPSFFSMV